MSPQSTDCFKRLAIFVEGKTEQEFIERLIVEVANKHAVLIETRSITGGTNSPRSYVTLKAAPAAGSEKYFVLIVDCHGDHQVKPRIAEEHKNLSKQGYTKIIGVQDVFPRYKREEIPQLRMGLMKYISTNLIPVEFVLSVMEVEAWFLAEFNHFKEIHPSLDINAIKATTSIDLSGDLTLLDNPANDLKKIYESVGVDYKKGSEVTLEKLDYAFIYTELRGKIPSIDQLMTALDTFLTQDASDTKPSLV